MRYSVILPAHRVDRFLPVAVRSVERAIDDDDAELIVVANGSDRHAVVDALAASGTSSKTRVIVSEIPSIIYCLNRAIDAARGEYVARFDSDDVCVSDRFRRQYEIAVREGADFLFSDADVIDRDDALTGERLVSTTQKLWNRCGPIHPTAFIKREVLLALGGYGSYEYCEDYHLWLRAQGRGYKLCVDHLTAIQYRVHGNQITNHSKLADLFATGIGVKLILCLREGRPLLLFGAAIDMARWIYRRCRNVFS